MSYCPSLRYRVKGVGPYAQSVALRALVMATQLRDVQWIANTLVPTLTPFSGGGVLVARDVDQALQARECWANWPALAGSHA